MANVTRATRVLDAAGIRYHLHPYDYDAEASAAGGGKGLQAASALQVEPARVLKTLMAWVDSQAICVVVPSDRQLHLKSLAATAAGKSARMMDVAEAERRTGYKVGGISPFGQQRATPTWFELDACSATSVFINAGQRGLLVELAPADALRVLDAKAAGISR